MVFIDYALGFATKHAKTIFYAVVLIATALIVWVTLSTIKQNGKYEAIIEAQQSIIETKNQQIRFLEQVIELNNETIHERDILLKEAQNKLSNLSKDLGDDAKDSAAQSLKEYFKRLEALND